MNKFSRFEQKGSRGLDMDKIFYTVIGSFFLLLTVLWANTASASENATLPKSNDAAQATDTNFQNKSSKCHPKLLALLRKRNAELQKRHDSLEQEEQDLDFLRREIDSKVKVLKDLQRNLEGPVKKKKYLEKARLQHLAGVYGAMEPARAAALLDKIDEETVTKLFAIMKSKKVAPILARMSPDKAARISAFLYRKPPPD